MSTIARLAINQGQPPPDDFRLISGTALTLYFNHRESFDLAWVCVTSSVDVSEIFAMSVFDNAGEIITANGGPEMVDCQLSPLQWELRQISMTFVEPHEEFVHVPIHKPLVSPVNDVSVAHPLDLVIGKLMAVSN
ncbi:MAG: hypothetical protein OXC80_13070 [Gammaproteobacteria bacterium]|nr:hypothetical protein [Gammaproteobacteria bacterium]